MKARGKEWMPETNIGAAKLFERGHLLCSQLILACLQEYVVALCRVDQSYGKAYSFTLVDRRIFQEYSSISELGLVDGRPVESLRVRSSNSERVRMDLLRHRPQGTSVGKGSSASSPNYGSPSVLMNYGRYKPLSNGLRKLPSNTSWFKWSRQRGLC